MNNIIDGKLIAEKINNKTAKQVAKLKTQGLIPKLAVILVGNDLPSQTYVKRKQEAAQKVGMDFVLYKFAHDILEVDLIKKIKTIQKDKKLSGIIVQLPLPRHLYTTNILNAIKPELDVDCLTDANQGKLLMNTNKIDPPTPAAVIEILKQLKINIRGKIFTIIGTGQLVGKPLVTMLTNLGATVIACNKETKNIKQKCLQADVVVTAVGKRNLLTADMIQKGTIVIDTGIVFEKKKMYGDVDFDNVKKKAGWITPVPGGVGPITVSCLLQNTLICAEQNQPKR